MANSICNDPELNAAGCRVYVATWKFYRVSRVFELTSLKINLPGYLLLTKATKRKNNIIRYNILPRTISICLYFTPPPVHRLLEINTLIIALRNFWLGGRNPSAFLLLGRLPDLLLLLRIQPRTLWSSLITWKLARAN